MVQLACTLRLGLMDSPGSSSGNSSSMDGGGGYRGGDSSRLGFLLSRVVALD